MALSNSQFNAILREYERLQAENRREYAARRARVMQAVPELKQLDDRAAVSAMERLKRSVLGGDSFAVQGFSEEIGTIEEQKAALLKKAGFPPDALEPHYHCAGIQALSRDRNVTAFTREPSGFSMPSRILTESWSGRTLRPFPSSGTMTARC